MSSVKPRKLKTRALLGAAVAAIFALSACSAGQVTQTDNKVPAIPGTDADIVNSAEKIRIQLRDMLIVYPGVDGYTADAEAPLSIRIFNSGEVADRLIDVQAVNPETEVSYADSVALVDESAPEEPATSPTPDADEGQQEQPGEGEEGQQEQPGQEEQPDEEVPAEEPGFTALDLPVNGYLLLAPGEGSFLQMIGLAEPLKSGSVIQLTFVFEVAGSITVDIPMALPTSTDLPDRETAEFNEESH
ncbi:hypothetical protein FB566_2958 [Stackebrandtia endophytica]|uniref:Copper(I)-binding protein n=1 Tax=Stackebrandtia endophytica TaxID=1496996 RepID=A0A543AXU1_9ACTN|nr:copper chaperone PCu(A)C [Stackebrandtia endophytica]TQL77399.1 hypothetical protein FB566_2958 [Stackebrandtia endophytica]